MIEYATHSVNTGLDVFVVRNQQTDLWDAACCNEICGYGLHGVSDDNTSKTAAEKAATAHRKHIRDLLAEREAQWARWGGSDWETRAVAAEAAVARVEALHPRDDSNPRGPWCGTCLTVWPCDTVRALSGGGND